MCVYAFLCFLKFEVQHVAEDIPKTNKVEDEAKGTNVEARQEEQKVIHIVCYLLLWQVTNRFHWSVKQNASLVSEDKWLGGY